MLLGELINKKQLLISILSDINHCFSCVSHIEELDLSNLMTMLSSFISDYEKCCQTLTMNCEKITLKFNEDLDKRATLGDFFILKNIIDKKIEVITNLISNSRNPNDMLLLITQKEKYMQEKLHIDNTISKITWTQHVS